MVNALQAFSWTQSVNPVGVPVMRDFAPTPQASRYMDTSRVSAITTPMGATPRLTIAEIGAPFESAASTVDTSSDAPSNESRY